MDNSLRVPAAIFVPDRRFTAAAAVGVVAAAALALIADDGPSRLLPAIAGLLLLAYVVGDLVFSPRVVATMDGITIRSPLTSARLRWDEVEHVRADTRARLGLRSTTLEIDAGATLAVLSRRALGADPAEAADRINAFRPPGTRSAG